MSNYTAGEDRLDKLIETIKEMGIREYILQMNNIAYSVKPDVEYKGSCLCLDTKH